MHHRQLHQKVGVVHILALHVLEEHLVEMILKLVSAFGQTLERQLEIGKLSHVRIIIDARLPAGKPMQR